MHKSNTDKVTDFMTFGSPMNQIFVMEALRRYAEQLDALSDADCAKLSNQMISMHALRESARQWLHQ